MISSLHATPNLNSNSNEPKVLQATGNAGTQRALCRFENTLH